MPFLIGLFVFFTPIVACCVAAQYLVKRLRFWPTVIVGLPVLLICAFISSAVAVFLTNGFSLDLNAVFKTTFIAGPLVYFGILLNAGTARFKRNIGAKR